jgi:hypothetical protein
MVECGGANSWRRFTLRVEQRREDGRAIEVWPAHKVDRAIQRHQGRGLEISDDAVLLDATARTGLATSGETEAFWRLAIPQETRISASCRHPQRGWRR